MTRFSKTILIPLLFLGLFSTASLSRAAKTTLAPQIPPQVILTWSASNFYPSNYRGKALPITQTPITVSVNLLQNGKFVDLGNTAITWYKSGDRTDTGVGLTQIVTTPDTNDVGNIFIRAGVALGDSTIDQSISIPIVQPTVAIEIPYPHSLIGANSDITLRAIPYFFNVASLNRFIFYWQVGDVKKNMGSEDSITLKIGGLSSQQTVPVSAYVQSKDDMTNIIKTDTNLFAR